MGDERCGNGPDSWPCVGEVTQTVTFACKHEHIRPLRMCERCADYAAHIDVITCGQCREATGVTVHMTVVRRERVPVRPKPRSNHDRHPQGTRGPSRR